LRIKSRSVHIRLPEDVVVKLDGLAESLGLSRSKLITVLLEGFLDWNYGGYPEPRYRYEELFKKLIARGLNPEKALRFIISTHNDYIWCIGRILEGLYRDYFKTSETEFTLIDMDWLQDYEGIWFHFTPTGISKYIFDDLMFQIQKNWDGYLSVYKYFDEEEYGDKVREIVDKILDAINSEAGQTLISEFEDTLYECADIAEFNVDANYDEILNEGILSLKIYVSEWECIPSLMEIDKLIRKLLKIAGVKASRVST